MSKKPQIKNADDALVFLDYMTTFTKGESQKRCAEIAGVIRELLGVTAEDDEAEWLYFGSPVDVVKILRDRSWAENVTDDDRMLFEAAATALEDSLDRNVKMAAALERTEAGL
jgi:hypothetical protein